jgi:hypothetical protein
MNRSFARTLILALVCCAATLTATTSASAETPGWLAVSGSTGYRASSLLSREPVIYAQSLDSLREERIGIAPGYVSSEMSAANGKSIAVAAGGTTEVSLMILTKGERSIKVDSVKDSECPTEGPAPAEYGLSPLSLSSDGSITYLKQSASTGCQFWIIRRDKKGVGRRLRVPPRAAPLNQYATIEVKGKLVLLSPGYELGTLRTIVYNSKSLRVVYTLPERFAARYRVHLATSSALGLSFRDGKSSSAIRVNLKNQREVRFEFPHGAEALFCGPFTVFAAAHLVEVYDADGKSAALLLSLTKFKLRELL